MGQSKCDICSTPYAQHAICDGCGILAGPGHLYSHVVTVAGLRLSDSCADCRDHRLELVAAGDKYSLALARLIKADEGGTLGFLQ